MKKRGFASAEGTYQFTGITLARYKGLVVGVSVFKNFFAPHLAVEGGHHSGPEKSSQSAGRLGQAHSGHPRESVAKCYTQGR